MYRSLAKGRKERMMVCLYKKVLCLDLDDIKMEYVTASLSLSEHNSNLKKQSLACKEMESQWRKPVQKAQMKKT